MTGKQLEQWRDHMGFSQQQAAEALGMTRANYSIMERRDKVNRRTQLACKALFAKLHLVTYPWE